MIIEDDGLLNDLIAQRDKLNQDISELLGNDKISLESVQDIENRVNAKPKKDKYMTGVKWLDGNLGGFSEGTYVNLAGQSFSGKTQLALKILSNIAVYRNVVLFSFEMYEDKLIKRLKHLSHVQKKNILVSQVDYSLDDIEGIIRTQANSGVRFFMIDSRMKIVVKEGDKEYQKISYMSNHLSKLCQELGIIVILINQISEEDLKHGRFSLKGSGDQFYDSDIVLFLTILENKETKEQKRWCYCKKDRDGEKLWDCDITDIPVETHIYQEDKPLNMAKI